MERSNEAAVVCGAGGFIGGHLVKTLVENGVTVLRAVDVKPLEDWYQTTNGVENLSLDLKVKDNCDRATEEATLVYQLAADMGAWGLLRTTRRSAC